MATTDKSSQALDAWVATQPQLRQLAESIALANGFQFDVLVSDDTRLTQAATRFVLRVALARTGVRPTVRRLAIPGRDPLAPPVLDPVDMIARTVAPLLLEAPEGTVPAGISLIDALGSREGDLIAWREVFRRLNENRNRIAQSLGAPLVICVPSWLQPVLVDEAPDLWSARTAVAFLDPDRFAGQMELARVSAKEYSSTETDMGEPSRSIAARLLAEARARFRGTDDDDSRQSLADALAVAGDADAGRGATKVAIAAYEESLGHLALLRQRASGKDDIDVRTAAVARALASALQTTGDTTRARTVLSGALDVVERALERSPHSQAAAQECAATFSDLGDMALALGNGEQARAHYEKDLAIAEQLAQAEPGRADYQRDLSVTYSKLGDLMVDIGHGERAREFYERALAITERLAQTEPDRAEYQRDLAVSYARLGNLELTLGQSEHARRLYEQGLAITERLAQAEPDIADYQQDLTVSYRRLGGLILTFGQSKQAQVYLEKGLAIAERLAQAEPDRADYQQSLAVAYGGLGDLMLTFGRGEQARTYYERALELNERLAQAEPDRVDYQRDVSVSSGRLGNLMFVLGHSEQARAFYEKDLAIAKRLAQAEPDRADYQRDLVVSLARLAMVSRNVADAQHALTILYALRDSGRLARADSGMIADAEALRDQLAKGAPPAT